jgi:hypothetical protein
VSATERTGVAVIRVWIERREDADELRGRITLVRDVEHPEEERTVAADADAIVDAVRRFVDDFVAAR